MGEAIRRANRRQARQASPSASPAHRTRKATAQAMPHCNTTVAAAAFTPPISRFTVATAATQGVYRRVNTKNTTAVKGVNSVPSRETSPPSSTVRVETTLSLAVKPVMRAVDTRQSPKPRGPNTGAASPPMMASRLSSAVTATLSRGSKVCRNQITIEATKMMVKAFLVKPLAFSQISCSTLLAEGRR